MLSPMIRINSAPTEHDEQVALIRWADLTPWRGGHVGDYLAAIPNGAALTQRRSSSGGRFSLQAAKLKAEGLRPGVPDLMLMIPAKGYHGLFIELKRCRKGLSRVRPEQLIWQERLQEQGYRSEICYGAQEAIDLIKDYLA